MPSPVFPGFFNHHSAYSYLKSTFKSVWEAEENYLDKTCLDKFRDYSHLNQYLYRYWQFAQGTIHPVSFKGKRERIEICDKSIQDITRILAGNHTQILCLNDEPQIPETSFESLKSQLAEAFEKLFPQKSAFELE